jgi:hypothetical protein
MKKLFLILVCLFIGFSISAQTVPETVDAFLAHHNVASTVADGIIIVKSTQTKANLQDALFEVNYLLKLVNYYMTEVNPKAVINGFHYSMGKFSFTLTADEMVTYSKTPENDKTKFLSTLTSKSYQMQFNQ